MAYECVSDRELVEFIEDATGLTCSSSELDYDDDMSRMLTYERMKTIVDDFIADNEGDYSFPDSFSNGGAFIVGPRVHAIFFWYSNTQTDSSTDDKSLVSGTLSSKIQEGRCWWVMKQKNNSAAISFDISAYTNYYAYSSLSSWSYGSYVLTNFDAFDSDGTTSVEITINNSSVTTADIWVWIGQYEEPDTSGDPDIVGQVETDTTADSQAGTVKIPTYAYNYIAIEVIKTS